MAVPELAPAGDIQFGLPAMYLRAGRGVANPKIFGCALRASGSTPLSKFLDPPLAYGPVQQQV